MSSSQSIIDERIVWILLSKKLNRTIILIQYICYYILSLAVLCYALRHIVTQLKDWISKLFWSPSPICPMTSQLVITNEILQHYWNNCEKTQHLYISYRYSTILYSKCVANKYLIQLLYNTLSPTIFYLLLMATSV